MKQTLWIKQMKRVIFGMDRRVLLIQRQSKKNKWKKNRRKVK